ncbi:unnamed protein product [Calypogeia fissa]
MPLEQAEVPLWTRTFCWRFKTYLAGLVKYLARLARYLAVPAYYLRYLLVPRKASKVLRCLVKLYESQPNPYFLSICQCLIVLDDSSTVATILDNLLKGNKFENEYHLFLHNRRDRLPEPPVTSHTDEAEATIEATPAPAPTAPLDAADVTDAANVTDAATAATGPTAMYTSEDPDRGPSKTSAP